MKWSAKAPSNIALIKYMGKLDATHNIPTNPSLSFTLDNLNTFVELEINPAQRDSWESLENGFKLSEPAQQRFLSHLQFLKTYFHYNGYFIVRSRNNFPMSSGLASSASSFAALTKVACQALAELTNGDVPDVDVMANLSREGSGSSCRSFFRPWSIWDETGARELDLPYSDLIHDCLLINRDEKTVSSSEAHRRVTTSPLFEGRPERATRRLVDLIETLKNNDWKRAFEMTWDEFQDMHELFATSTPSFHYMTKASHDALNLLQKFWAEHHDGPLVTMDAGPNIHLLYRPDQKELAEEFSKNYTTRIFNSGVTNREP